MALLLREACNCAWNVNLNMVRLAHQACYIEGPSIREQLVSV